MNSVSTLLISSKSGAQQAFVQDTILNAEALFIAGGNQADYVNFWQGTPVNDAINQLALKGVPLGGTSAGNAILAGFAYSALLGSVTSSEALANPFDPRITLDGGFLALNPLLQHTITDDHFVTRDRMGRLVAFLARIIQSGWSGTPTAIAADEETAFLMESNGGGTVVGAGTVYFLKTPGPPEICAKRTPLTFNNLSVYRIDKSGTFDVSKWTGAGGVAYSLSAASGVLESTQPGGAVY